MASQLEELEEHELDIVENKCTLYTEIKNKLQHTAIRSIHACRLHDKFPIYMHTRI